MDGKESIRYGKSSGVGGEHPGKGRQKKIASRFSEAFSGLQNGPVHVIGIGNDEKVHFCNAFHLGLTGQAPASQSLELSEIFSPSSAALLPHLITKMDTAQCMELTEVYLKRMEGAPLAMTGQLKAVSVQGERIGTAAILYPAPVSETKISEELLFEYSPLGMALCQPDGEVKAINAALEEMLGYSLADYPQLPRNPLFPDIDFPHPTSMAPDVIEGRSIRVEAPWSRMVTKDGKQLACIVHCHLVPNQQGNLKEMLIVVEDRTDHLATRKTLLETEERSRLLFEMAPISIGIRDLDSNTLVDSNRAFTKMIGSNRSGVIGIHRSNYIHEENATMEAELLDRLKRKEIESYQMEKVYKSLDGKTTRGLMTRILVESEGKQYAVAYIHDISSFKEQEMRLEAQNSRLIKMNQELDRFMYSATHELRAPLTSIQGLLELIRMENTSESIESLLNLQERSLKKLDSYIKKVVHHSQNKRSGILRMPVDFKACLAEWTEELRETSEAMGVHVTSEVNQEGEFYSDLNRLKAIVMNVLVNAVQFSDPKKNRPFLHVSIKANEIRASINLQDNGIGLAKDLHQKVFDMFFRASIRSKGSGLGLYIAREMVEKLGGDIELGSVVGEGTTVFIDLPSLPPQGNA